MLTLCFFIRFVVIAGDISPIDVISHVPVMCEDNSVPYVYVPTKVVRKNTCFSSLIYPRFFGGEEGGTNEGTVYM